jgi:uncharacterized protein (UPF0332 family)
MRFERCIEEGLIKRDPRAEERVEGSLQIAERFLKSAKRNLDIDEHEMAEIAAYNSAFHSARALLFARGYTERSHSCLGTALKSLYQGEVKDLANTFDRIRLSRHDVQYGGALVSREDANLVIEFAEDFLKTSRSELLTSS